ncbi:hypothetical protein HYH02_001671 [Chlamydomonas schloesseri]|uniref:Uncharacterized protein n=1 Tax=Chlamydomonas schloesseri TaxID=2026947 RepID=A0A835WVY6_9CHLO|nr:hypothetical protein HYH02_001671 [Chlamydomonas schloesseri]|eukprot:KAG2453450.1 hypothetical protein HYH02_001671 [Chlamydomonas schloesseri]
MELARKVAHGAVTFATVASLVYVPSVHATPQGEGSLQSCPGAPSPAATSVATNPLADLAAGFFGGGGDADSTPAERDPITPFTLYGTSFKKYLIEELQGEKVISRKKGFTVNSCVGAVSSAQETPQFQGLPTGDKALYAKDRVCKKAEGQELKEVCRTACESACTEAIDLYDKQVKEESGFALLASDKARLTKSCTRNCSYECAKPGKAFDFVIPYRR